MPIALVQASTMVQGGGVTSLSVTLNSIVAGDLIPIVAASNHDLSPTGLTDSSGDTVLSSVPWVADVNQASQGQYYVENASAGTHTVTISFASGTALSIAAAEYSGAATTSALDSATPVALESTSAPSTASLTPSGNGELAVALFSSGTSGLSVTWPTGLVGEAAGGSHGSAAWADEILSSTSALAASCTLTSVQNVGLSLALFKAANGGSTITGSASITEGADTASATGTLAISGTASITEANDTVAATGAIAMAGTAAITEASDTVAATGVGGEVGTAAIAESSDTVSATGALSVTGTAAITESDDTVSATGALSVTGSAGITEGADTVAATGAAGAGATAAITEQPDVVAATGGIALSGAAAIFEAGDIVVATGALGLAGTAAITEAPDSVAATGGLPPQVTQGAAQWTIARSATRNFSVRRSVPRSFTLSRSYTRNFTVNPMAVRFPVKGTSEKVPLTFDFTQDLPSGVTLTGTPTIGVSVSNGTDSNPTGILNGAAGFNSGSTQVIQPVQGGVNGADYSITCTCPTTQSNLTLSLVGLLSVRRDLN